jgi:putative NADPH-quinone reductase
LRILPFDYGAPRQDEDFDAAVERILAHRNLLVATPVYWYAMSGVLKTFLDRLSDLLSGRDPSRRGRALAGRRLWLLAAGTDPELPHGFEVPFASFARYLGLDWRGHHYVHTGRDAAASEQAERLDGFAGELRAALGK